MAYEKVCTLDDLWEGEMEEFEVDGEQVLVVNMGEAGGVHAVQGRCPHQGVDLVEGDLDQCLLTCRMHLWQFDVVSGKGVNPSHAALAKYPVKVENEEVYVDVAGVEPKHCPS